MNGWPSGRGDVRGLAPRFVAFPVRGFVHRVCIGSAFGGDQGRDCGTDGGAVRFRLPFQRNGSWYGATEGRAHLQRKYDYLLKKDKVDTAEQFIERAASKSSMSGRAYRVKCDGREQDASAWFELQLKRLRDSGAATR